MAARSPPSGAACRFGSRTKERAVRDPWLRQCARCVVRGRTTSLGVWPIGTTPATRTVRAQGHNSLPPEPVCRRLQFFAEPLESDAATLRDGAATTSSPLKGADGEATTAQATTPTTEL
ncbi:hypothetical protein HPB52_013080 [Rhipicephalus sanguineus]|uniref:Uncharacterized protein n=1 Tax=Rhipicephalus sanguineus TaxID=34632 RepID=A0A9D4PDS9_RHISA|nr:hypothetical protein HPB52_013080 [Rhipicephalus sanguineus]